MKRSGIFLLNSRLLFKTVFKKIKTSIWLVDDIYVNRAEPRLEFWARVCLLSVTFLIVISRHAHTGSRYQNTKRLKGSCWDLRYQLALVPNNSNPGLSGEQKRLQIFFFLLQGLSDNIKCRLLLWGCDHLLMGIIRNIAASLVLLRQSSVKNNHKVGTAPLNWRQRSPAWPRILKLVLLLQVIMSRRLHARRTDGVDKNVWWVNTLKCPCFGGDDYSTKGKVSYV